MQGRPSLPAIAVALALGAPASLQAQGPPIRTDTPILLGVGGRGARAAVRTVRRDQLLRDGERIPDALGRSATTIVMAIAVPYSITASLQVGVAVPLVSEQRTSGGATAARSGVGDVSVLVKKVFFQVDRRGETIRAALKGSVRLPTGDEDGSPPLGAGSTGLGLGLLAAWIRGRWGFYGEALFQHEASDGGIEPGDRLGGNLAVGFRLLPAVYRRYPSRQLNLYVEVESTRSGRAISAAGEHPDSGGSLVFVSPGVQFVGGRRWLVEASVQLPVLDEPNGTQLGTSWAALVGTRVLLF